MRSSHPRSPIDHPSNSSKSQNLVNSGDINLDEVLQNFAGAQVQFLITYLDLSVCLGQLRMVHLQPILDRVVRRLLGWQGKLMNIGG
jgi:hypothetical protein